MILIHGPTGGINWNYTSTFLRNNYADFLHYFQTGQIPQVAQDEWAEFGAGREPKFTCGGCRRVLPLAVGEVDHVVAKSTLTATLNPRTAVIQRVGSHYTFPSSGRVWTINISAPKPEEKNFQVRNDGCLYLSLSSSAAIQQPLPQGRVRVVAYHQTGTPLGVVVRNDVLNLQLLCSSCNRSKGNR
jgi:5-methylcytosine-specific restriction endonuclease McrA